MDNQFKQLIKDAHKLCQDKHIYCVLYSVISRTDLSTVSDIDEFVDKFPGDMLYIKSSLTDNEIEVYEYQLEGYKIKHSESMIYIKLKNKSEVGLMY